MLRSIVAAAIAVSVPPPLPATDTPVFAADAVALIQCGQARGTAFYIDDTRLISAAHVTSNGPCTMDGHPLEVVREDGNLDFVELRGPDIGVELAIDCHPMREGGVFHATGYAHGQFRHTVRLLATRFRAYQNNANGLNILIGSETVIPGMSGGPVFNRHGKVVAIVNRRGLDQPISFTRSLSETHVCRG